MYSIQNQFEISHAPLGKDDSAWIHVYQALICPGYREVNSRIVAVISIAELHGTTPSLP